MSYWARMCSDSSPSPQTVVNSLTTGNYSIVAGMTTWQPFQFGAENLFDLLSDATSNVDQWDVFIAPPVDAGSTVQTAGGDTPDTRPIVTESFHR